MAIPYRDNDYCKSIGCDTIKHIGEDPTTSHILTSVVCKKCKANHVLCWLKEKRYVIVKLED
jgi:hypothetical protein